MFVVKRVVFVSFPLENHRRRDVIEPQQQKDDVLAEVTVKQKAKRGQMNYHSTQDMKIT